MNEPSSVKQPSEIEEKKEKIRKLFFEYASIVATNAMKTEIGYNECIDENRKKFNYFYRKLKKIMFKDIDEKQKSKIKNKKGGDKK